MIIKNTDTTISKKDTKLIRNLIYSTFFIYSSCRFYLSKADKKIMKCVDEFFTQNNKKDNKNYQIDSILAVINANKCYIKDIEEILKKYKNTIVYKEEIKRIKHEYSIRNKGNKYIKR